MEGIRQDGVELEQIQLSRAAAGPALSLCPESEDGERQVKNIILNRRKAGQSFLSFFVHQEK